MSKALYSLGVLEGFVSRSTVVPQNVWDAIREIKDSLDRLPEMKKWGDTIAITKTKPEEKDDANWHGGVFTAGDDSDEIEEDKPVKEKKERKKRVMTPKASYEQAARMRAWQNKKRVENGQEPMPDVDPAKYGYSPESNISTDPLDVEEVDEAGDSEVVLHENGVKENPDGSLEL